MLDLENPDKMRQANIFWHRLLKYKIELKITSTNALNPVCLGPGKEAFGNAKEKPGGFLVLSIPSVTI